RKGSNAGTCAVFLPLELAAVLEPGINGKPSASLFLSLASRTYRTLALEAWRQWLRVLFLKSPLVPLYKTNRHTSI
ncbi:hypothetical protein C8J57DRAFT_1717697, partial [Mycena rebaudengoi]